MEELEPKPLTRVEASFLAPERIVESPLSAQIVQLPLRLVVKFDYSTLMLANHNSYQ